ncbi:hypothetical protein [uncultured Microbacterium sp.]|uniref:hypothetical protein n=1 Tax=uncultured Microbacterium sp. TaxID=191216 RepID=UPI0025DD9CDA|nr:hypothetical protein [uncultured Microbacterium sp.]
MRAHRSNAVRLLMATALIAALALAPGVTPATAAWQVTAAAPSFALSLGTLTPPAPVGCQNQGTVLNYHVRLSWPRVTGATSYELVALNTSVGTRALDLSVADSTAVNGIVSADVQAGLLNNIVALLSGNPTVGVVAVNGAWRSDPSSGTTLVPTGLVSGLLGGLRCPTL